MTTQPVRAAALVLVWSSGFIGAELGVDASTPATVLAWRFLVTAAVLLPWLLRALADLDRWEWIRQAVLALLCQCLYLAGVFWAAAEGVPAGTSALVASLQPALVLVAASLAKNQRLRTTHLTGLLLGSTGVALTASGDLRAGVGLAALALPFSAMLSLTAGTLLQQRWARQPGDATPLMQTLAVQAVFGAAFFTTYGAAAGALVPPSTIRFWIAIGWAVLAGIGSYGLYYLVTTRDGAARASTLLYLTPAATALWATGMFGEPLRAATVVGLLISAAAVVVLTRAGNDVREGVGHVVREGAGHVAREGAGHVAREGVGHDVREGAGHVAREGAGKDAGKGVREGVGEDVREGAGGGVLAMRERTPAAEVSGSPEHR